MADALSLIYSTVKLMKFLQPPVDSLANVNSAISNGGQTGQEIQQSGPEQIIKKSLFH